MSQAKRSPRTRLRLPVSLGRKLPAMTADISPGGFSIELPQVFLPHSQIDGFVLDGDRELPFAGEVTWAEPGNPQLSVYSRMGVRFTRLSPPLKKLFSRRRKK